jgi:hypothetical protein
MAREHLAPGDASGPAARMARQVPSSPQKVARVSRKARILSHKATTVSQKASHAPLLGAKLS